MSDLTTRLDATAREALGALLAYHRGHITRIEAALEALDGPVVPLVRPPAPDIEIAAPVQMPKVPQREQRPAAKVARKIAAPLMVTCGNCGREYDARGIKTHYNACKLRSVEPSPLAEAVEQKAARTAAADVSMAGGADVVYCCVTCGEKYEHRSDLSQHTIREHRRGPMQAENAGVAA